MQSLLFPQLTKEAPPPAADPLFMRLTPARPNRWRSFSLSIGIHVLGLLLLPPLTEQITQPSDRELWRRQQRLLRTLHIRIPEQLYVASSAANELSKKKVVLRPEKSRAARGESGMAGLREPARPQGAPRRRFQLPPLPRRMKTAQTILQPQFAPDMPPEAAINLPEVFFWAPRTELPRYVKPFQMPGYTVRPTQPRVLDAPPKLEVPTAEPAPVSVPPTPDFLHVLQTVAGSRLPLKTADSDNGPGPSAISAEQAAGDPTTLLSLAREAQRMREFLSVPPGNQLGQLSEGGPGGRITGAEGGGGRGVGGRGLSGTGTGGGGKAGPDDIGAGGDALSPEAIGAAAVAAAQATRIQRPVNGVFDVVVQSSGLEGFPESAGVLSGKPVYSVFVQAGAAKDWIMQYCIPASDDRPVEVSGAVVRLTGTSPLTAPYPYLTMRPALRPRPGRYVMVHGAVTASGLFEDLRVLGVTDAYETAVVLAVLEQWRLRPAMRDGKPVKVEILLAIPAE